MVTLTPLEAAPASFSLQPLDGGPAIDAPPPPAGAPPVRPPISDAPEGYQPPETPAQTQAEARGIGTRIVDGIKQGFGSKELGLTEQDYKNYPWLRDSSFLQGLAATFDAIIRAPGAVLGGAAGAVSGGAEVAGMSPANADRLMRDVGVAGQVALAPEAPLPRQIPRGQVTGREAAASLRSDAKTFYQAADEAGLVIKSDAVKTLADGARKAADKAGLDVTLTPDSVAVLKRVDEATAGRPLTLDKLDTLRQIASDAQAAQKPKDRAIASQIVEKIDDFMDRLTDNDVISGDQKLAADAITQARDLWSRSAKLDTISRLVERAEISAPNFSGSGMENALRTEFRALAKNDRAMRTFTKAEQEAIKKIAKGTAASNTARNVGKLAPSGVVSGALSGGIGATVGTAIGIGPTAGAAITTGGGFAARRLAAAMAKRYVGDLERIVATGGRTDSAAKSLQRGTAAMQILGTAAAASAQDSDR